MYIKELQVTSYKSSGMQVNLNSIKLFTNCSLKKVFDILK
jgi:hypothetical protein